MRRVFSILVAFLCAGSLTAFGAQGSPATQTVDRIVARVEGDIILLSEARELAAYQQLVDGHSQSQQELIEALIEQWVVRTEAEQASFPEPEPQQIDAAMNRIQGAFAGAQAYRDRLAAAGLTQQGLQRIVGQQLYLERYLDYKFRPAVQIDDEAISKYYQDELSPAMRARGQEPPPLDEVRERIREVLVQRGISERADTWFEETKSRLQVEITPAPAVDSKR
jgi:hypothetical protein